MIIRNIDQLSEIWEGLEKELFKKIDNAVQDFGLDITVHEKNIHNLKSYVSDEISSAAYHAEELFNDKFSEEGMPLSRLTDMFEEHEHRLLDETKEKISFIKQILENMNS
ncbi:hypothetical protein I6N96_12610 [Enterococcus sp. BWM-S5]|uniref:Uncharacterized protein n=1 Tax=Enterococcus larvae TaxID=2794352 RepID=A0ABS4CKI2_9ENTE|nr:hypothetical protein [Enterococcus larvae]MBP1047115.1 hypothetical protein [Enterococcus larvae]